MHGAPNVYYLWYGNWSAASPTRPVLTDLANTIGGTPWAGILVSRK